MNKFHELRVKWIDSDPKSKKIWCFCIALVFLLLSWQVYSNHEYHRFQNLKSLKSDTSNQSRLPNSQNSSGDLRQTKDSIVINTLLPQTNRNLGLEELKADFDYTRQVVFDAKEELHLMAEQNKQLQSKIALLEQMKQNSLSSSSSSNLQTLTSASRSSQVDFKSNLPPPIDFTQSTDEELAQETNRFKSTDSHLNLNSSTKPNSLNRNVPKLLTSIQDHHNIHQWGLQVQETKPSTSVKSFVTIPATSVIDAVMLSGINARTSATGGTTGGSIISANNVGSPFISRVKGAAILPNGWRVADLTDCFLSGTGIGILSTERANVTADKLTCVNAAGLIFEARIRAYGVDLDGIQGLSGRLVTKQGSILAKEAAAGMFAGVGAAFSPQALPSYNSSATSGSQQGFVMPNTSLIAGSAVGQGVSTSLGQLSKFYLDYARQMFPIVEVNAGTRVSWVVQESFDLVSVTQK